MSIIFTNKNTTPLCWEPELQRFSTAPWALSSIIPAASHPAALPSTAKSRVSPPYHLWPITACGGRTSVWDTRGCMNQVLSGTKILVTAVAERFPVSPRDLHQHFTAQVQGCSLQLVIQKLWCHGEFKPGPWIPSGIQVPGWPFPISAEEEERGTRWQPSKTISSSAAESHHARERSRNCSFSLLLRRKSNQLLSYLKKKERKKKSKKERFNWSIIRDLEVLRACSAVPLLTGVPSSEMQLTWRGFLGTWGWIGQPNNPM